MMLPIVSNRQRPLYHHLLLRLTVSSKSIPYYPKGLNSRYRMVSYAIKDPGRVHL